MKYKLLQILLGAIGSSVTVLIAHWTQMPDGVAITSALGAGPATSVALGNLFTVLQRG